MELPKIFSKNLQIYLFNYFQKIKEGEKTYYGCFELLFGYYYWFDTEFAD